MNGTLYLIPVYLSEETDPITILAPQTISIIHSLQHFIVENEKSARAFLKAAKISVPQNQLSILVYNKKEQEPLSDYFKDLSAGISVGILTEAGCPGIADPGAELIAEAHGDSCDLYGVNAHRRLLEWCEKLSYLLERCGMLPAAR